MSSNPRTGSSIWARRVAIKAEKLLLNALPNRWREILNRIPAGFWPRRSRPTGRTSKKTAGRQSGTATAHRTERKRPKATGKVRVSLQQNDPEYGQENCLA